MININTHILDKAIEKWGINSQFDMLQEECMELAMAIHKYRTRDSSVENLRKIYDELADVLIMSEQAKRILEESDIQERIDFKINRLTDRINKSEESIKIPEDK